MGWNRRDIKGTEVVSNETINNAIKEEELCYHIDNDGNIHLRDADWYEFIAGYRAFGWGYYYFNRY